MDRNSLHFHHEQLKSSYIPMWISADNHLVINAFSGGIAVPCPALATLPAAGINPSTNSVQVLDRVNPAPLLYVNSELGGKRFFYIIGSVPENRRAAHPGRS